MGRARLERPSAGNLAKDALLGLLGAAHKFEGCLLLRCL